MNPKQHAKRNTVLRVIAFLLIVALVYGALTRLLTVNNATEQQYIRSFYLEPKNSLDVMILGASETFTDYCAPLAWQHAGFTSYPLAVSAAQGTMYPSMLREAAKRQSPAVYVVEVNGFLYTEDERKELGTAATILGASETFTDYCAPLAWQHAGFTSYPLAVSAAQGTMYPSMLREAARRQTPGVYVVEVNGFLYTAEERDEFSHAALRKWIDTIPLSANKLDTIRTCIPAEKRSTYYFPLLKYHTFWKCAGDIRRSLSLQQQARSVGYSYTKPFLSISMFLTETDEIPVRQQELDAFNEQSLRTFCETAKKLGIQNVLFARFPHRTVIENYDAVFAKLESVVQEYGYDFVNFDTQIDAIGLDPLSDFANAEHLNVFGAEKFTPYLADYLTTHYDLNTAHSDKVTDEWTRCAAFTQQMLPVCEDNTRRYTSERLDEFSPVFAADR